VEHPHPTKPEIAKHSHTRDTPAAQSPPVSPASVQPVDPGLNVLIDGQPFYLAQGIFVKFGQQPAIYVVSYGALHAFPTWQTFLAWGGQPDLSNVLTFNRTVDLIVIGAYSHARPVEMMTYKWHTQAEIPCWVVVQETGERIRLPSKPVISFGRLREHEGVQANDIVLLPPKPEDQVRISRWHFELRQHLDGLHITALSDQITAVDEKLLARGQSAPVRVGTLVRLAGGVMALIFQGEAGERVPLRAEVTEGTGTAVGADGLLVCRGDVREDLVYQLTKEFFAQRPARAHSHGEAALIDPERGPATPIPLHPGAARYYREREILR